MKTTNLKLIVNECISLRYLPIEHEPRKNKKINLKREININHDFSICGLSKMIYRIDDTSDNKVKIMDKDFIEKNKDKCIIGHKDKFYHLTEFFPIVDIKRQNEKILELLLNCWEEFKLLEASFSPKFDSSNKSIDSQNSFNEEQR